MSPPTTVLLPRALRWLAITIAGLSVLDPTLTSARRGDGSVAVVAADPRSDSVLAERVAAELEGRFEVVRGAFGPAGATVLVGSRLPAHTSLLGAPAFVVVPETELPSVRLERVEAPARVPLDGSAPVTAVFHVRGGAGTTLEAVLRWGDVTVDRRELLVLTDEERVRAELSAVPAGPGPVALGVVGALRGTPGADEGEVLVEVADERWTVLFFDPRPSWMSTFVRRALEQDARFDVTSRIVTSRDLGTDFGDPPRGLGEGREIDAWDAVVVGAPEALEARDVDGLEAYLRRRGGSVVLLMDRLASGPHERLLGVSGWSAAQGGGDLILSGPSGSPEDGPAPLRATEAVWPLALPPGAWPLVEGPGQVGSAVVWAVRVGAGSLLVSGALDAWRFRDPETSGFEEFWRVVLAEAAASAAPAVEVRADRGLVGPGDRVDVRVVLSGLALDEAAEHTAALVSVALEGEAEHRPVRMWPEAGPGRFRGSFRAPAAPGEYRLEVRAGDVGGGVPLVVASAPRTLPADDPALLGAWASSRGGGVRGAERLGGLGADLAAALAGERRREPWHPMRSGWWILPFALALGGEWWWRRRRGLP